jgi:hypothetical protein
MGRAEYPGCEAGWARSSYFQGEGSRTTPTSLCVASSPARSRFGPAHSTRYSTSRRTARPSLSTPVSSGSRASCRSARGRATAQDARRIGSKQEPGRASGKARTARVHHARQWRGGGIWPALRCATPKLVQVLVNRADEPPLKLIEPDHEKGPKDREVPRAHREFALSHPLALSSLRWDSASVAQRQRPATSGRP